MHNLPAKAKILMVDDNAFNIKARKISVALSIGDLEIFAPLRYLLASGELPSL